MPAGTGYDLPVAFHRDAVLTETPLLNKGLQGSASFEVEICRYAIQDDLNSHRQRIPVTRQQRGGS